MGNLSSKSSDFSDVIRSILDTRLMEMNICLPAKIVTYDSKTQYASLQCQLLQGFLNGTTQAISVLPNVPVKHPRANGGDSFIHMPLKTGDDMVLVFSQRSLDNWKTQGGLTDPADQRKFDIADAYALIGGSALPNAFNVSSPDAIEIVNSQTKVIVHPNGKLEAKNNTAELIDILDQITEQIALTNQTLSVDTVNTWFGPQQLLHFQEYEDIYAELELLKTKLDSFKV